MGSSWWSFEGVTFPVLPVMLLVHHPFGREVGSADLTAPFQLEPLWNCFCIPEVLFSLLLAEAEGVGCVLHPH